MPTGYYQTPVAAAIHELGQAYLGGLKSPREQAAEQAEIGYREALTKQANTAAAKAQQEIDGRRAAAGGVRAGMSQADAASVASGMIGSGDTGNLGNALLAVLSNFGADQSPQAIGRAMVGSGEQLDPAKGVTVADRDAQAARMQGEAVELENIQQAGQTKRQGMADAAAGDRNRYSESQANVRNAADNERALQTNREDNWTSIQTNREDNKASRANNQDDNARILKSDREGRQQTAALAALKEVGEIMTGGSKTPKEPTVRPSDLENLRGELYARVPQELGPDYVLPPELDSQLMTRTAELYRQTGDAAQAADQAWKEANPQVAGQGWFDGQPRLEAANGSPPAPNASTTPAPAVQDGQGGQQAQQVPPAPQRQKGAVYQTPKGPMKWTGTGWVPAGGA